MGQTSIYTLDYLDPYENTGLDLLMDQRRFNIIESQLYAQASIFGNGIIDINTTTPSWEITTNPADTTGQSVLVTSGSGRIGWVAASTTASTVVSLTPPPGASYPLTFWLYATANSTTPDQGTVTFYASTVIINSPNYYIGLGGVVITQNSTSNGITYTVSPQNTTTYGRNDISLFASLAAIINAHVHIGGANNPSPIDLSNNVQGLLDGSKYITNLNASTITQGTFSSNRLPQIDHQSLLEIGTLTHSEIDSLLASIIETSNSRLSDIAQVNLIKLALAARRQSALLHSDATFINTILLTPGITSDFYFSYTSDFAAPIYNPSQAPLTGIIAPYVPSTITLATIDKVNKQIVGTGASGSNSNTRIWTTDADFDYVINNPYSVSNAPVTQNIVVVGSGVGAGFTLANTLNYQIVVPTTQLQGISGSGGPWASQLTTSDNSSYASVPPQGIGSAPSYDNEFVDDYGVRRILYTIFSEPQDWATDQQIGIGWGLNLNHSYMNSVPGIIYCAAITGTTTGSPPTLTLSTGIAISNDIPTTFTQPSRTFSVHNISAFGMTSTQLTEVVGIAFFWQSSTGWNGQEVDFTLLTPLTTEVNVINPSIVVQRSDGDNSPIFAWNQNAFTTTGTIVFRTNTNYPTTLFNNVVVDTTLSTNVSVTTRVADTQFDLGASQQYALTTLTPPIYTSNISGYGNTGQWFDIIVTLTPYTNPITLAETAPVVADITLNFTNPALPAEHQWLTLSASNTATITSSYGTQPFNQAASMINVATDSVTGFLELANTLGVGQFTFIRNNNIWSALNVNDNGEINLESGSGIMSSPSQIWAGGSQGFTNPRDFTILSNGNYVVADTANDRIVEIDPYGNFISGVIGNIRQRMIPRDFVLTNCIWNPTLGILYILFSQNVQIGTLANISLISGQNTLNFGNPPAGTTVNATPYNPLNGHTATVQVGFSSTLVSMINGWGSLQLVITAGSFTCAGSSTEGTNVYTPPTISNSNTVCNGSGLPGYITGPPDVHELLNQGSVYTATSGSTANFTCVPGIVSSSSNTSETGDYNGDNIISNSSTAPLFGPNSRTQINNLTINVYNGNWSMDNLFSPTSIQVDSLSNWVVSSAGSSVVTYYNSGLVVWSIPATSSVFMQDGLGGSAYLLSNGNVVVAAPGITPTSYGQLTLVNQSNNNAVISQSLLGGDGIYVLPDSTQTTYWVAVDDRINNGTNSQVIRIDGQGKIQQYWGNGTLLHPTGLALLPNDQFVVAE